MYISANAVCVDFPIYSFTGNRSLKKNLISLATGGRVARDASDRVTIRALNNVCFELFPGDRVGLLGHNGSGKSTLLKVLAGIFEPTQGELEVSGRVCSMLSITTGLDYDSSGLENIYLRGILMGLSKTTIDSMVDDIVDFADLGDFINFPMRTYSSGMSMRLAFAIATSTNPDIILMDEWLSAGDSGFAEKANNRLSSMVERSNITVIASHNPDLIQAQCNRVITLEHGEITSNERVG